MATEHSTDADRRSPAERSHDTCARLHDSINGLLNAIHVHNLYQSEQTLLALQDAQAHLAAAEQLLQVVRDGVRS